MLFCRQWVRAMSLPSPGQIPRHASGAGNYGKPIRCAISLPTHRAPASPPTSSSCQNNPYADYSVAQLYDFLASYKLSFAPGTHYEYANLGFGLLGHALALRAGSSYEDLVVSRICAPLGMDSTRITLSPSMKERLAGGHDASLAPVANWDIPTLAGAGAFRSTANDLFTFLEVSTGNRRTPLAAAMEMTFAERRPTGQGTPLVGQGWFISTLHNDEIRWKDGGTGGYAYFVGFSTKSRRAASCCPMQTTTRQYARGHALINVLMCFPICATGAVDPQILGTYAGQLRIRRPSSDGTLRWRRLVIQATAQAEFEVYAESATEFFYRVVDAKVSFARRRRRWRHH